MNFLAHIYLSGNEEGIILGNFIADGIKGKRYLKYPPQIAKGILLHRAIDTFTDAHPTVHLSTARLHKNYSHYSGVIVDILYDHLLAKNWPRYSNVGLDVYVQNFYQSLEIQFDLLPVRTQKMIPYMKADNWLLNYANIEGIQNVLNGMNRRTKNISGMDKATMELKQFYAEFEMEFSEFFEELRTYSKLKLVEIETEFKL